MNSIMVAGKIIRWVVKSVFRLTSVNVYDGEFKDDERWGRRGAVEIK